jgi:NAD(P)-dependent dehydrogenase (short-subunit alcohol dehydrogenase family)
MNEVALVTGSETLTGRKLIEKLLARGTKVVAPIAGKETDAAESNSSDLTVLTWNRSSWFSTKAVIRESLRFHGRIDSAWILHHAAPSRMSFADATTGDIESVLEQSVKGSIALVRELAGPLSASGGLLGMVLPFRPGAPTGPMDAMAAAAFAGFAGSYVKEAGPLLWACGFASGSPDADGFSSDILRLSDEKPGKLRGRWFRYSGSRRPFSGSTFVDSVL